MLYKCYKFISKQACRRFSHGCIYITRSFLLCKTFSFTSLTRSTSSMLAVRSMYISITVFLKKIACTIRKCLQFSINEWLRNTVHTDFSEIRMSNKANSMCKLKFQSSPNLIEFIRSLSLPSTSHTQRSGSSYCSPNTFWKPLLASSTAHTKRPCNKPLYSYGQTKTYQFASD